MTPAVCRGPEGHFQLELIELLSVLTNRLWGHNFWISVMSVQAKGDFCTGAVISGSALIPECVCVCFSEADGRGERYYGIDSCGIMAPFKAGHDGERTRLTVAAWVSIRTHNHTDTQLRVCV